MSTLSIHTLTRRVDLFTLRLFPTVVEEGQIRKAAVRENIAPSAATKRIQDLEEIAGLPLFRTAARRRRAERSRRRTGALYPGTVRQS